MKSFFSLEIIIKILFQTKVCVVLGKNFGSIISKFSCSIVLDTENGSRLFVYKNKAENIMHIQIRLYV